MAAGGISDLMQALADAGAPMEAILIAVRAIESRDAADRARKDRDAERKRMKRAASADIPRTVRAVSAPAAAPPPNDIYSNPPVPPVEAKASTAPRGRSDRGSKISESWKAPAVAELTPEAKALAERWPSAAYRAEAEAFRNYWLGESSAKARKSDWNRAWSNRIVAVNGKVMRDAKFAGVANLVGKSNGAPMNAAQLRSAIAFAEDNDNPERAAELRRQLAALSRQTGPPRAIGELISGASSGRV